MTTIWWKSHSLMGAGHTIYGHTLAAGIEVCFGVWPVTFGHRAGMVLTYDGWQSVHWTEAKWQENTPNYFGGYDEYWVANNHRIISQGSKCFYALWVEDSNGVKHWDNNRGWNYELIYH